MRKGLCALLGAALLLSSAMNLTVSANVMLAGDVNCDGILNVSDAIILSRYVSEDRIDVSAQGIENADMDGNGELDSKDLTRQLRTIANLPIEDEEQSVEPDIAQTFDTVPVCVQYRPSRSNRAVVTSNEAVEEVPMMRSRLTKIEWWISNENEKHVEALDVDLHSTVDNVPLLNIQLDPNRTELSMLHIKDKITYLPQELHFCIYGEVSKPSTGAEKDSAEATTLKLLDGTANIVMTRTRNGKSAVVTKSVQIYTDLETCEITSMISDEAAMDKKYHWNDQNTVDWIPHQYTAVILRAPMIDTATEPVVLPESDDTTE